MTETKPKHTPGPWTVRRDGDSFQGDYCITNYSKTVLIGDIIYSDRRSSICEANARLIAAAPELLDLLEEVLECDADMFIDCGPPGNHRTQKVCLCCGAVECEQDCTMNKVRAAIAKVKGESKP